MPPTLFNLYINDLATDLIASHKGLLLDEDFRISSLLYADDLVILSDNEENLQRQLQILEQWCLKWRILFILDANLKIKTNFKFNFNNHGLDCVDS